MEVTPILNVSDLQASFEWFAKLGWEKGWDWCPPDADSPTFGAVTAEGHEIFLCLDGQEDVASTGSGSRCGSTTSTGGGSRRRAIASPDTS